MSERLLSSSLASTTPGVEVALHPRGVDTKEILLAEVEALKRKGANGQRPWYLLPGTGFNVRLQLDQFEKDLQEGIKEDKNQSEILDSSFQKIEQDIQGFKIEYLCEGLLFPIVLDTQIVNDRKRIVTPLYNSKLYLETVSQQERQGAVKKSLEQVEDFLLQAPAGSIAIMTSPPGPSGFEGINYSDSQTYIWQVQKDGKPRGFTVRTDMNLNQNKKLLIAFGKNEADLLGKTPEEELTKIVSNPILITQGEKQKASAIEDVIETIKYIKGSNYAYKGRFFNEISESLKNPEALWTLDETTQQLIEDLKKFVRYHLDQDTYTRLDLEIALGTTILKLASTIRKPKLQAFSQAHSLNINQRFQSPTHLPYRAILFEIQSLPGCNGGGNFRKTSIFTATISPRYIESFSISQSSCQNCGGPEDHFHCPGCGGQITSGLGITTCPHCGLTKDQAGSDCG